MECRAPRNGVGGWASDSRLGSWRRCPRLHRTLILARECCHQQREASLSRWASRAPGSEQHGGDCDPGSPAKPAFGSFTPCNVNGGVVCTHCFLVKLEEVGDPPELGGARLCQHASASLGLRVQNFASMGVLQASKAEIQDVLKCTRGRGKRGAFSDPGLPVHRLPLAQELGMPT